MSEAPSGVDVYKRQELRDPHANYNKMSMEELKKNYPTFDWDAYLSAMGSVSRISAAAFSEAGWPTTVSYTHLDVYKRQSLNELQKSPSLSASPTAGKAA